MNTAKDGPSINLKAQASDSYIFTPLSNIAPSAPETNPSDAPTEASSNIGDPDNPQIAAGIFSMKKFNADRDLPIVYAKEYNIHMVGLELMHQFDTKKYQKIAQFLNSSFSDTPWSRQWHVDESVIEDDREELVKNPRKLRFLTPNRAVGIKELEMHHTADYIKQIHEDKAYVARIVETWAINLVPMSLVENRILQSIKYQVSGSIFAAYLAIQHGWAINLGGGFHQASADMGETFCLFSDVVILMKYLWRKHPLTKFMIVDLDAHQATGIERDLCEMKEKHRKMVFMVDVFNTTIHPPDPVADKGIDIKAELGRFTGDDTYLKKVDEVLTSAFQKFKPSLVIYVAGQDVLKDDQLGLMNVSPSGLIRRDESVFSWAHKQKCPIVMLLGGGYLQSGSKLFADSIKNLYIKNLIWGGHRSGIERSLSRPMIRKQANDAMASHLSRNNNSGKEGRNATQAAGNLPASRRAVKQTSVNKKVEQKKRRGNSVSKGSGQHLPQSQVSNQTEPNKRDGAGHKQPTAAPNQVAEGTFQLPAQTTAKQQVASTHKALPGKKS